MVVGLLKGGFEDFRHDFEGGNIQIHLREARNHEDEESLPDMPPMALPGDNQPEKELSAAEPKVLKFRLSRTLHQNQGWKLHQKLHHISRMPPPHEIETRRGGEK